VKWKTLYVSAVLALLVITLLASPSIADPTVRNVTMYFHSLNAPVSICGLSAWSIFNTTTLWTAQAEPSAAQTLDVVWTMYPALAGDLKINGQYSVSLYIKANATATGSQLQTWLFMRSPTGTETSLRYAGTTINVGTAYQLFTITSSAVSQTVPAGYTLRLEAMVNLTGAYTFYMAYGSATYPSKMVLAVDDHIAIATSSDKDKVLGQDTIIFTAKVKDAFGGYDLHTPTITIKDSGNVARKSSVQMTASSVGDTQYENTWTYTYKPYNDVGDSFQGVWSWLASFSDNSGNSLDSQTLNFQYQLPGSTPQETPGGTEQPPTTVEWLRQNAIYLVAIGVILAAVFYAGAGKSKRRRR